MILGEPAGAEWRWHSYFLVLSCLVFQSPHVRGHTPFIRCTTYPVAMCQREPENGPPGSMHACPLMSLHALLVATSCVHPQGLGPSVCLGVEEYFGWYCMRGDGLILSTVLVSTGCLV